MTRKEIGEAVGRKMAEKKIKANHFRKIGLNDLTMRRILKGQNYRWISLVAVLGELGMDFKVARMEDCHEESIDCKPAVRNDSFIGESIWRV